MKHVSNYLDLTELDRAMGEKVEREYRPLKRFYAWLGFATFWSLALAGFILGGAVAIWA